MDNQGGLSVFWVEVHKVDPNPFQPRKEFAQGALESLAQSIRQYGVLQPLVVTKKVFSQEDGSMQTRYELIAGERRLRASKIAGLTEVPVIIRSDIKDDTVRLELAIIENLQREDLNPIDRAKAFKQLIEEFTMTHSEVAQKMGRSREYITNSMRLLSLPEDMVRAVLENKISEGHTRPLLMLSSRPDEQRTLFREMVHRNITVRDSEVIARRVAVERSRTQNNNPKFKAVESIIEDILQTRVHIQKQGTVGGRIIIDFFSDEELESIAEKLVPQRGESLDTVKHGEHTQDIHSERAVHQTQGQRNDSDSIEQKKTTNPFQERDTMQPAQTPQHTSSQKHIDSEEGLENLMDKNDDDLYDLKNFSV